MGLSFVIEMIPSADISLFEHSFSFDNGKTWSYNEIEFLKENEKGKEAVFCHLVFRSILQINAMEIAA